LITVYQRSTKEVELWGCRWTPRSPWTSVNEWLKRMKCVVQQNGKHIEHLFKQLFSRYAIHDITATVSAHENCMPTALLVIYASFRFTHVLFYAAPLTVVQLNRVKVT